MPEAEPGDSNGTVTRWKSSFEKIYFPVANVINTANSVLWGMIDHRSGADRAAKVNEVHFNFRQIYSPIPGLWESSR